MVSTLNQAHPFKGFSTVCQRHEHMELLRSHVFGNPHSTNRLDLSSWHRDFVPLSFYKIFGYPTGVGCLLARKGALAKLRRPWYAGGTITLSSNIAANILERKEKGEVTNEQYTCNTAFKTHSWSLRPSG